MAVYIGLVYSYLPFMVLPLFATLEQLDGADRGGAGPRRAAGESVLGHHRAAVMPGIVAGSLLCFIPIVGEFVIPDLLGGSETLMIGKTLWSEFFGNRDWPLASAVAVVVLLVVVVPIVVFRELEARRLEAPP